MNKKAEEILKQRMNVLNVADIYEVQMSIPGVTKINIELLSWDRDQKLGAKISGERLPEEKKKGEITVVDQFPGGPFSEEFLQIPFEHLAFTKDKPETLVREGIHIFRWRKN